MSDNRDGLDCILQAINNIVEPKVAKLKYDKTYRAKVTQQIDTGLYMVKINNVEYKLPYNGTLNVGDIVNIPANVKHWHGAAPDSWFSHIAVEVDGTETSNEWLEPVTDEEYDKLHK